MRSLLKRALSTLVGLVIMLVWWSLRPDGSNDSYSDAIPEIVWGGGAAQLTIEATTNCPAYVSVSFEGAGEAWADQGLLETHENLEAGTHTWTIDVPDRVGGMVELGAREPKAGNQLRWRLYVDGELVDEQAESLREELDAKYAFFLQMGFEDYGSAQVAEDW